MMSDTAPSVSSEVNTPVQRMRSSGNRSDLVGINCHLQCCYDELLVSALRNPV